MSFIVSIEGNIGSGKSTLLKELKKCSDLNNKFVFVQEPVDEWNNIKDSSGESIIQKFYANQGACDAADARTEHPNSQHEKAKSRPCPKTAAREEANGRTGCSSAT